MSQERRSWKQRLQYGVGLACVIGVMAVGAWLGSKGLRTTYYSHPSSATTTPTTFARPGTACAALTAADLTVSVGPRFAHAVVSTASPDRCVYLVGSDVVDVTRAEETTAEFALEESRAGSTAAPVPGIGEAAYTQHTPGSTSVLAAAHSGDLAVEVTVPATYDDATTRALLRVALRRLGPR